MALDIAQQPVEPLGGGRYQLVEVLGSGGMAVVYRAWDHRLKVARAIKLLLPEFAQRPDIRRRFETEATTMARLAHPSIVAVHDIGAEDGRVYIVMDLVEGGNMWHWVQDHGPMPARMALQALRPVMGAMGAAHSTGVVHRDIKPQNILLTLEGKPKVSDFGIAQVGDDLTPSNLTRTGAVMGTWGYMAPEQRHSAKSVDERSDVYALGATLWALITGMVPVDLFAATHDEEILSGLDDTIAELVGKATRYKPGERYQDVFEMQRFLDAALLELPPLPPDLPKLGSRRTTPATTRTAILSPSHAAAMSGTYDYIPASSMGRPMERSSDTFDFSMGLDAVETEEATSAAAAAALSNPVSDGTLPPTVSHSVPPGPNTLSVPAGSSKRRPAWLALAALGLVGVGLWAFWPAAPPADPVVASPAVPEQVGPQSPTDATTPAPADPDVAATALIEAQDPPAGTAEPAPDEATTGTVETVTALPATASVPKTRPPSETAAATQPDPPLDPPESVSQAPGGNNTETVLAPGRFSATGEAESVLLVGADGSRHGAGSVPAGEYSILARFPGRDSATGAGEVTIGPGQEVAVHCTAAFAKCQ